ncbi:hypothetical protein B0H10DRAFT_2391938 [Mycena sp. CBHHK59/15]|nr:hypothetical protein B0H10DRAFT_2391938 [Mycena sp. CBHHK59/15]
MFCVRYQWDSTFNIADFQRHIDKFNSDQIERWITDELKDHGVYSSWDLKGSRRLSYAFTVKDVHRTEAFAIYANDLVRQAQAAAGLREKKILIPAVEDEFEESDGPQEGLFLWRISSELMWQQVDRRIDEVFEVLYAFHRVNDHQECDLKEKRLITLAELSRRAIRPTVDDEFGAFSGKNNILNRLSFGLSFQASRKLPVYPIYSS